MADLNIEAMSRPTTPTTDYSGLQKQVATAAASTRDVGVTALPKSPTGNLDGINKKVGQAAVGDYYTQAAAMRGQAEKAGIGIEMMGQSSIDSLMRLDEIGEKAANQYESAAAMWDAPAEQADEYVTAARARVRESLATLEGINAQMGKDMGFAKAHDMQVAAQSVLGSMKTEERNILQTYGMQSKEYESFQASKSMALGTIQSQLHGSYAKLRQEMDITYLNATNESMWKHNMYVGFQEQQHVEMLKWRQETKQAYALQYSQFEVGLEQLKGSVMENVANWIVETPNFTMESAPVVTLIADLAQTEKDERNAYMTEMRASNEASMIAQKEAGRNNYLNLSSRGTIGRP